jgi:nucleoporin SEH1
LGLLLATCSKDGHIRIYEAVDVMNLSYWPLSQGLFLFIFYLKEFISKNATCITWNPSKFDVPTLAVGSEDGTIKIWQFKENLRTCKNSHLLNEGENIKMIKHTSSVIHDIRFFFFFF